MSITALVMRRLFTGFAGKLPSSVLSDFAILTFIWYGKTVLSSLVLKIGCFSLYKATCSIADDNVLLGHFQINPGL